VPDAGVLTAAPAFTSPVTIAHCTGPGKPAPGGDAVRANISNYQAGFSSAGLSRQALPIASAAPPTLRADDLHRVVPGHDVPVTLKRASAQRERGSRSGSSVWPCTFVGCTAVGTRAR
jgi:hypothetical protein